ncbi:MAG: MFS transporter [Gemmatimonadetes bacterium]|nr:MFS transporter [Gemmatimonadota bacterium]
MYSELLNRRFIALLIVSFFSSFVSAPLNTLLPVYVEADLLGTPLFSGGLRAAFLILGGVFAVPAGRLADTWGVKPVYVLGTLGPILAGVIFYSGDPLLLTALCTGIGISSGFNSAGGQSYLISAAPSSVIGIASAGYFLGNTLGSASGNFLSGPIADAFGFQILGFCITLAGVVLVLMSILVLPAIPSPKSADNVRNLSALIQLFRRLDVCLLLGIRYLPTSYWGAVTLLLPLLIFRIAGTSTAATNYSAISLIIAACFQVLTGRLCDRIGRWRPILVSASLVAISALGLALTAHTLTGIYAFGILATASAWSLSTTMPGLIQLIAREDEKGRVVGAAHLAWSLGMLSGSLGGGKLIDWGPVWPFGISVLFCLGALACGVGLYRLHGKNENPLN